jgi:hypothetical protein
MPEAVVDALEAVEVEQAEGDGSEAGGAGQLDGQALLEGAAVGQAGERVLAALARLRLEEVGVGEVGGDQVAEQFQGLDVPVAEVVGLWGVDLEDPDRLALVKERDAQRPSRPLRPARSRRRSPSSAPGPVRRSTA